jgi:hypothetical protein
VDRNGDSKKEKLGALLWMKRDGTSVICTSGVCHTHNTLLNLNQDIFSIQRGRQVILVLEFIDFCSTRYVIYSYFSIIMYYNLLQFAVQYDMESTIVANNSFPVWKNRAP